jgi:hypothetical protein
MLVPQLVNTTDLERIVATLLRWQGPDWYGGGLQAGDMGWKHRFGAQAVADAITEFVDGDGETLAIMMQDTPGRWWFAMDPARYRDRELAEVIGAWADQRPPDVACSIDGPASPAVWREVLARRGFDSASEAFVHFWQPLSAADGGDVPGVSATRSAKDIEDRVLVQRGAFENSTFTVERWRAMAAGPGFHPELDLVARTDTGAPASALTAWFGGEGRCGMIEPMGTHHVHRRLGHGVRVLRGACAALAKLGASGVTVMTPASSPAAVGVYRAAGFKSMGQLTEMVRPPEAR